MKLTDPNVYIVSRTSSWSGENKPCEEAERGEAVFIDERTCADPADIEHYGNTTEWWYGEGANHRVINGHIMRDMGMRPCWLVKIDNLRDFVTKYGRCVIDVEHGNMTIEIYDDYRE